jgi:hypothetical protein
MDRRKISIEKNKSFYETLNSDELNLELAANIENMLNLREIIKMKAREDYQQIRERKKIFTFHKSHQSLDDNPRSIYVISLTLWFLLYRVNAVSKLSLLFMIFGLNFYYNLKRQYYCKIQKEYKDYKRLNDNYHQILKLKRKSMTMENFLLRIFGTNFTKSSKLGEKYLKYEYLY